MNRGRESFGSRNPVRDDSRKRAPERFRGDDQDWDELERRRREDAGLEGDLRNKLERSFDPDHREQGFGRQTDYGGDRDRDGFSPDLKSKELKIFGFGIPGQGFYALDVDVVSKPVGVKGAGAIIKIIEGNHSVKIVEEELKYWVEEKWQWNVRSISNQEYYVSFPSAASLTICMRSSEPVTPLYKMRVLLKDSELEFGASSMLHSSWVRVFEVPDDARNADSMKEISKTFGRPRDIDLSSLTRKGHVRVKVDCRDPRKLRGRIEIFLNSAGFKFRIEAEGIVWNLSDVKPDDSPSDDLDDPDDRDQDDEVEEEWDRHRLQNKDKDKKSSSGNTGKRSESYRKQSGDFYQLSCFSPARMPTDMLGGAGCSRNDGLGKALGDSGGVNVQDESDSNGSTSPNGDVTMALSWNDAKLKAQVLSEKSLEELDDNVVPKCTPKDDVFDKGYKNDEDILVESDEEAKEEVDGGDWVLSERNKSRRTISIPFQAKKKSSKFPESGGSILEKAGSYVAAKNMETTGMHHSKPNLNFAILNSVSPEYLEKIALDSKISFDPALGSNIHQIYVLRANELVQARLAETNSRLLTELEERKNKEANQVAIVDEGECSKQVEGRVTRSKVKGSFLDKHCDDKEGAGVVGPQKKSQKARVKLRSGPLSGTLEALGVKIGRDN
ncbi:hypothetical protein ACQ4PT_071206 [Festuca glaucescens]